MNYKKEERIKEYYEERATEQWLDAKDALKREALKLFPKLKSFDTDDAKDRAQQPENSFAKSLNNLMELAEETFKPKRGVTLQQRLEDLFCCTDSGGYRLTEDEAGTAKEEIEMHSMEHVDRSSPAYNVTEYRTPRTIVYGSAGEQLSLIGRRLVPVAPDGNCLFESVARQNTTKHEMFRTNASLRELAVRHGWNQPEKFEQFVEGTRIQYREQIRQLDEDGVWNLSVGDVVPAILADLLNSKIVVIQDNQKPVSFPDDGMDIDENTIVVVRDDTGQHYDATEMQTHIHTWQYSDKSSSPLFRQEDLPVYGDVEQQVAAIGRAVDPVPKTGDSLFESISRQIEDRTYTAQYLRNVVYNAGYSNPKAYEKLVVGPRGNFYTLLNKLKKPGFRHLQTDEVVLQILQMEMGIKIVVIKDKHRPHHYPDDGRSITKDCIVITRTGKGTESFFNSTKFRTRKREYQSREQQVKEMGRTIGELSEFGENSMFEAIGSQIGDLLRGSAENMRQEISDYAVNQMVNYAMKVGCDDDLTERMAKYMAICQPGVWFESLAISIPLVAYRVLNRKIIVVRDRQRPWYFPYHDGKPVARDTIVIVQYFYEDGPKKGLSYYLRTYPEVLEGSFSDEELEGVPDVSLKRSTFGSFRDRFTRMTLRRRESNVSAQVRKMRNVRLRASEQEVEIESIL